jgi:hypothetical protein
MASTALHAAVERLATVTPVYNIPEILGSLFLLQLGEIGVYEYVYKYGDTQFGSLLSCAPRVLLG